jgi:hypothetical protein
MTELQIKISPQDIENAVTAAIIDSSLGAALHGIVQQEIKDLASSYPEGRLRKAIRTEVQRIVLGTIRDEYAPHLKEAIRELMSDEFIKDVTRSAIEAIWKMMENEDD